MKRFGFSFFALAMLLCLSLAVLTACGGGGDGGDGTSYIVSFDSAGGSAVDDITVKSGECAVAPDAPSRTGYDFAGWDFDFTTPITADVTVKAKWQVKAELQNFEFTATANSFNITGVKDKTVSSVVIPEYVTSLIDGAFAGCVNLTSVNFPASVTSIGEGTFEGCVKLSRADLGGKVGYIGDRAFKGCSSLLTVTLPSAVSYIGDNAFEGCVKLIEVVNNSYNDVEAGSTENGGVALYAKSVHKGESRLAESDGFSYIEITGVKHLLDYSGSAADLVLPANLGGTDYVIGESAFAGRMDIFTLTIPDGAVSGIMKNAFSGCERIHTVTLGEGVLSISEGAFSNCVRLVEIVNRSSLVLEKGSEAYGGIAFYAKSLDSSESAVKLVSDFYFITVDGVNYIIDYIGVGGDIKMPTDYNGDYYEIAEYAFRGHTEITSLNIPEKLIAIGKRGFEGCANLKRIEFQIVTDWFIKVSVESTALVSMPIGFISGAEDAAYYVVDFYIEEYWRRDVA